MSALAKAGGAEVSWKSMAMDAAGVIPGGRAIAGAQEAGMQALQTTRAVQGTGNLARLIRADTITIESAELKNATGVGGKVRIIPVTIGELKVNGKEAVENAAAYARTKSVIQFNKMFKQNIDPFSRAGIAAGAEVTSANKAAFTVAFQGGSHLSDKGIFPHSTGGKALMSRKNSNARLPDPEEAERQAVRQWAKDSWCEHCDAIRFCWKRFDLSRFSGRNELGTMSFWCQIYWVLFLPVRIVVLLIVQILPGLQDVGTGENYLRVIPLMRSCATLPR